MGCLPCHSSNKVGDESDKKNVKKNFSSGLWLACLARSLLFGSWELISEKNEAAFLKHMGGMNETRMRNHVTIKKQIVRIKPSDREDTWLYRLELENAEAVDVVIKFGEELRETNAFRVPTMVTYIRDSKNKVTAHYVMYDGRRGEIIREVKWWCPNRMITTMALEGVISVRIAKRIRTG